MKIIKQPKLFLEKIDGTIPVDNSFYDNNDKIGIFYVYTIIHSFMYAFKEYKETREDGIMCSLNFNKFDEYFIRNNIDLQILNMIKRAIKADPYAKNFAMNYKIYHDNYHKNYVLSKNLTKYLERISLDIPAEVLPTDFFAYMEPTDLYEQNDNTEVKCAFVIITTICEEETLMVSFITESSTRLNKNLYEFHTLNVLLDREKTLDVICDEHNKLAENEQLKNQEFIGGETHYRIKNDKISQSNVLRTILNTVLYVNMPNKEFIEQFNSFSDKIKKRKVQEKCLSIKKFIRLGYDNAEHLKLIVEKNIEVGWHTKMQPYGPGRKYRKRIVVGTYNRKQKSYFNR